NESIRYKGGMGWRWHDFSSLFKNSFRNLPNITKYHHFHFSKDNIGKVYVAKNSGGLETPFELLKNDNFNKDGQLNIFEVAPLTEEKKKNKYPKFGSIEQYQLKD